MGRRKREKPQRIDVTKAELESIIERAHAAPLGDEDCAKLKGAVDTLAWVQEVVASQERALARLRDLFGLNDSEKRSKLAKKQNGDAPAADADRKGTPGGAADCGNGEGGSPADAPANDPSNSDDQPAKPRRPGHGRRPADEYTGATVVPVPHPTLKAGDPCPSCSPHTRSKKDRRRGRLYEKPPSVIVRVTGQAPLHATVYQAQRLRCHLCGETFTAPFPAHVGEAKYDARSAAMIGMLKYGSGLPFNRLERLEESLGIPLPAGTQWEIVEDTANRIEPAFAELARQCAQAVRVYNDDTSMRVLALRQEIDRAQADGTAETERTGIFTSSVVGELGDGRRAVVFRTGRDHAGENLQRVLDQRAPDQPAPLHMCDGLDRNFPKEFETLIANCLVHGRRHFVKLVEIFPDECFKVIDDLALVYKHDADARDAQLSDDGRLAYHQAHSAPVMNDLRAWMKAQIDDKKVEPNGALGGAFAYMEKRWDPLTQFLRIPGAPLDNSLCERTLKKIILHRKNALFFKTLNGARVGDCFISLIHTAELNGVNPFDYLVALIENADDVARAPADWQPWTYQEAVAAVAELAQQRASAIPPVA